MSAKDLFHQAVKHALIKEQWDVTDDPLIIQFGGVDLRIDLGAEKLVAAEKDGQRIAVEIKSFLGPSIISDFHVALGQFLNYQLVVYHGDFATYVVTNLFVLDGLKRLKPFLLIPHFLCGGPLALEAQESDRTLYLAVPEETFNTFFHLPFAQLAIQRYQLVLIVYNVIQEEIIQWIH